jgi:CRP-like cAMP-binding protein
MNNFEYLKPLSNERKKKIGTLMEEKQFSFNQNVFVEGSHDDNIYLIKEGEFEMTKDLYIKQTQKQNMLGFRRLHVDKNNPILGQLFDERTQIFLTSDHRELTRLKVRYKKCYKNNTRICLLSKNESIGLLESIVSCPYRITNVKCVSMKATVLVISREEFFRRVSRTTEALVRDIVQRIKFLEYRIMNQAQVTETEIDPTYYNSIP